MLQNACEKFNFFSKIYTAKKGAFLHAIVCFIYLFIINRVKLQLIIFLKTNFVQKIYKNMKKRKQKRHR
jgi:hypothetical protein